MIDPGLTILAALIALIVDRFVLVRAIGHSTIQGRNSDYTSAFLLGCIVFTLTTISAALSGLLAPVLTAFNGTNTILLVFIISLIILAIPIEIVLSYKLAFDTANRFAGRALLISGILIGIAVIRHAPTGNLPDFSFQSTTLHGAAAGFIFLIVSIIAVGIRERLHEVTRKHPHFAITLEILTFGIIALVFSWCKGL